MAALLEEKYDLKQDVARDKTVLIENKVRLSSPSMKDEYRDRCVCIMKCIKVTNTPTNLF